MSSSRNFVASVVGLVAGVAGGMSAHAQAPSAGVREDTLQEVVITAERRAESLNQMPVAGDALSTSDIERRNVMQIDDLQNQTPSLSIKTSAQNRFVTIRGVGLNATTATIQTGVATHVDGLALWGAAIALGNPFYDLERVEVLRGPQGTFAGQNSTGGAVFIVSRSPALGVNNFNFAQTIGNYGWSDTEGAGNFALTEHSAARIAAKVERRDSFWKNVGAKDVMFGFTTADPRTVTDHPGDLNDQSVRLKYLWAPSDALSVQLEHERYKLRTDGTARSPIYNFAGSGTAATAAIAQQYANEIKANTDPYTIAYNSPSRFDTDLDRSSIEVKWQMTPGLSLRSLTGIQHFLQVRVEDNDATIHPIMQLWYQQGGANAATPAMSRGAAISPLTETGSWSDPTIGTNRTLSQEFNLLSTTDSPLQWAVGAFYEKQNNKQGGYTSILESPGTNREQTTVANNVSVQDNGAVFGQLTWRTGALETTLGLRWNRDTSTNPGSSSTQYRPNPQNATGAVLAATTVTTTTVGDYSHSAATGKLALNWHLNDSQIVYGTVSKGYKTGNFNNLTVTNAGGVPPPVLFQPETVWNYEIGWKATTLDGHLHTDLTAFRMKYSDFQLAYTDPISLQNVTANLPSARIQGLELQLRAQFGGFAANLTGSTLDAKVDENTSIVDGRRIPGAFPAGVTSATFLPTIAQNLNGQRLPFAPPTTYNFGLEYAIPVGASGSVIPRVQYAYIGDQWASAFQIPSYVAGSINAATPYGVQDGGVSPDFIPSYHTVDATLTWQANEAWQLQAFGTNLSDEVYIAGVAGNNRIYSAPRQWGLRFRYQH